MSVAFVEGKKEGEEGSIKEERRRARRQEGWSLASLVFEVELGGDVKSNFRKRFDGV